MAEIRGDVDFNEACLFLEDTTRRAVLKLIDLRVGHPWSLDEEDECS